MTTLVMGPGAPKAGDLVLARIPELGYQLCIELRNGRRGFSLLEMKWLCAMAIVTPLTNLKP